MQVDYIEELNEQNFQQILESSTQTPVLIHFWASMNQESVDLIPQLHSLAHEYNGAYTLATIDCEQQQGIASQFGVQTLPTMALFINGQAVDGLGGPHPIDSVRAMLLKHLPSQDDLTLKSAIEAMEAGQHSIALKSLQTLPESYTSRGDIKLALVDCLLETQQFEQAKELLNIIPLEYKDNYYKGLVAKLELHEQAADSPEIQALEAAIASNPSDLSKIQDLALQYHQVGRSDEALELLWNQLKTDLGALDGELKKSFMDILSALGQESSTAKSYRRQLYSILY